MEKINKQLILNCEKLERRFAILSGQRLEDFQIERNSDEPRVGDIYLGKIINLEPSLQAAFIDIGADKNAFLHYHDMLTGGEEMLHKDDDSDEPQVADEKPINAKRRQRNEAKNNDTARAEAQRRKHKLTVKDIPEFFKPGTPILVQVSKSQIGTKGAKLTTDIALPGRYLVLMPYCERIALSSRIENKAERERLRKILSGLELPEGMGLICRTVGEGARSTFFKRDLELLLDYWHKIEEVMGRGKAPAVAFAEQNLIERTIRDFLTDDIDCLMVDDKEVYKTIQTTLKRVGGAKMAGKVKLYNLPKPIFETYQVNEQLKEIYQRQVKLPGGGYICIDETEALIAIDVNSGRGRKGAIGEDFIYKTNLEAAAEVARQLKLRNVGGLVVIDFIDMTSSHHRDEVLKLMKKLTKDDKAKTRILPISRLGLMEMTRQREHESIKDQFFDPCPYCKGTGLVKSALSVSVEIQRKLNFILQNPKYKKINIRVIVHPEILARLKNEDAGLLADMEKKYANDLSFRPDGNLHYEEFRLIDPETMMELE